MKPVLTADRQDKQQGRVGENFQGYMSNASAYSAITSPSNLCRHLAARSQLPLLAFSIFPWSSPRPDDVQQLWSRPGHDWRTPIILPTMTPTAWHHARFRLFHQSPASVVEEKVMESRITLTRRAASDPVHWCVRVLI